MQQATSNEPDRYFSRQSHAGKGTLQQPSAIALTLSDSLADLPSFFERAEVGAVRTEPSCSPIVLNPHAEKQLGGSYSVPASSPVCTVAFVL